MRKSLLNLTRKGYFQQKRFISYGHDMHSEMMEGTSKVTISDYDEHGFVVNGVNMRGSVLLFPDISMLWKPMHFNDITKDSLALVGLTNPATEILLIGCGDRIQHNLDIEIRDHLRRQGVVVELLDTMNACATFNILNAEDRRVAAALLPEVPLERL